VHDSVQLRRIPLPPLRRSCVRDRMIVLAAGFLCISGMNAQSPTGEPASGAPQQSVESVRSQKPSHKPSAAQAAPPAPVMPNWPVNDRPSPATIAWNSPQLRIDAANSSLQQILSDVSTATGASFEGLPRDVKDERVFGDFGPGPAHDVLSELLQGTGYNVVMIGDQGQGVPRQIILSARSSSKTPQGLSRPTPDESEDDSADYPQYDPQPPPQQQPQQLPLPVRPGFPADGSIPGRIPMQYPQQQQQTQPSPQPAPPRNQQ
jgi:hypothetical protein